MKSLEQQNDCKSIKLVCNHEIRLLVCSSLSLTLYYFKMDDFVFTITEENAFRKITT